MIIERTLPDGTYEYWETFQGGGFVIRQTPLCRYYYLSEIPQYGGDERYYAAYASVNEAIAVGRTWT